jgi:hypothetical protein
VSTGSEPLCPQHRQRQAAGFFKPGKAGSQLGDK